MDLDGARHGDGVVALTVRPVGTGDEGWVVRFLTRHWGGPLLVTRGRAHRGEQLPGIAALHGETPLGLATYRFDGADCELVSLNSDAEGRGVGTALLSAVEASARAARCSRLWLITTNDNTPALRFYQRRGFRLVELHRDAIEASRKLKPEIPRVGRDGIPLRDELELEMLLDDP